MDSKILLWLAGELGWEAEHVLGEVVVSHPELSSSWWPFTLEGKTPINAWLREKVVEWLGDEHGCSINPETPKMWSFNIAWTSEVFATRTKAIIAAVEWLYHKEHDHD